MCFNLCNTTAVPELRYYETCSEIENVLTRIRKNQLDATGIDVYSH